MDKQNELLMIYNGLLSHFGPRNWWPADEPFEVIIGAILTQNVSWSNAKKAVENLKSAGLMDPFRLYEADAGEIASLIVPSRYYNMKAQKIKNFINFFVQEYNGDLSKMSVEDVGTLRNKLLSVKGLGKETVDSIILYACSLPIFVVDSYTKRVFLRYGLIEGNPTYDDVQRFFTSNLPVNVGLYNDFHAQIDHLGNMICKNNPKCNICPINHLSNKCKCLKKI